MNLLTHASGGRPLLRLLLCACIACCLIPQALAQIPQPRQVAPGVYALYGDLGPQTSDNEGLNANIGFVVGDAAVLVVNTGPSRRVGQALLAAIRKVTALPIRWVVNLNSQNHYWWGNSVFDNGSTILIAHPEAIRLMGEQRDDQRIALAGLLGDRFEGSRPVLPAPMQKVPLVLDLGNREVRVLHLGGAHTPGDIAVWIPGVRTLFTGDIVYTERLPAVLPISNTRSWIAAFAGLAELKPEVIIPGHGSSTDIDRARTDTFDYLTNLRVEAKRLFDAGAGPADAPTGIRQESWNHLINFPELHQRNASLVFLEVERELF